MKISIIVAKAKNNVIGKNGSIPWYLPNDLKHFRITTRGKPLIMGRKTFLSIGHPLPNRINIVLTTQKHYKPSGVVVVSSLPQALNYAKHIGVEESFIIGGQKVYQEGLKYAERLYITEVDSTPKGDTYFPQWDFNHWQLIKEKKYLKDDQHQYGYTFALYDRIRKKSVY